MTRRELLQAAVGCDVTRITEFATGCGLGFDVAIYDPAQTWGPWTGPGR